MCFSPAAQERPLRLPKTLSESTKDPVDFYEPFIPGLPDDVAKYCLALVPRKHLPRVGAVSKQWRAYLQSREFLAIRKDLGKLEEWLFLLMGDRDGKGSHWEVKTESEEGYTAVPPMPGPVKAGFGVVTLDGNLLIMAGHFTTDGGDRSVSSEVYQYDSRVNRWSKLTRMNVARFDFACAEVNGLVYAVGGYGSTGESLSSAEVYDPLTNRWALIQSLRRPRWGGFACGIAGKLYVMGGRSTFTIGNSRSVDVYSPERGTWGELKKQGCVMVTTHVAFGDRVFCMEWKDQRRVAVFLAMEGTWGQVSVPVAGGAAGTGFRLGVMQGKLLLLASEQDAGYETLVYDLELGQWGTSSIKPSGSCLCSVTIHA
ncbi:galactose oxidase/kelch repeat superfamily protein [Wolffia australiana]